MQSGAGELAPAATLVVSGRAGRVSKAQRLGLGLWRAPRALRAYVATSQPGRETLYPLPPLITDGNINCMYHLS